MRQAPEDGGYDNGAAMTCWRGRGQPEGAQKASFERVTATEGVLAALKNLPTSQVGAQV
jgi:hypothetical protein